MEEEKEKFNWKLCITKVLKDLTACIIGAILMAGAIVYYLKSKMGF